MLYRYICGTIIRSQRQLDNICNMQNSYGDGLAEGRACLWQERNGGLQERDIQDRDSDRTLGSDDTDTEDENFLSLNVPNSKKIKLVNVKNE